mgnify:CR=1 FL=1|jgi:hypothetical protein
MYHLMRVSSPCVWQCGPGMFAWPWMWRTGVLPSSPEVEDGMILEVAVWLMTFSSLIAELGQIRIQGLAEYWKQGWNKLDIISLSCMTIAFAIRVAVSGSDDRHPQEGSDADLHSLLKGLLAVAAVTLNLRFLESLSYNKDIGELYTIFLRRVLFCRTRT